MKSIHEGRISKAARAISARLDSQSTVTLTISSSEAENKIYRILSYMNRYCGRYMAEFLPAQNRVMVIKLG